LIVVVPIPSTHLSLLCDVSAGVRQEEAWASFEARYRPVILAWGLRRGLSPDAAEDLTQDVLLKLFQQLPRYRHDPARGRFRSWLKAVVNNALTDFWRRRQHRPERDAVGGTAFQEHMGNLAGPEAAAELSAVLEQHSQSSAAAVLERVRGKLKETTWQAFYQTMVEQRPAAEVASALGLSVATVYKATYRVKQLLLEEYRHVHGPIGEHDSVSGPADPGEAPAG
jgi:RNA polymerase sigma-70 factor (ECF subfamily)